MSSSTVLRVGIVGLEFGAEFIPIYQQHPNAEMYAICQRTQSKLDEIGDRYDIPVRYTDYDAMLADPNIDVIHINTPLQLHADQVVAALEAGIHIRDADGEFDARPAKLRRDGGDAAYIRVTEGRYHPVKRMFAARGKHVVYLKRMAIGSLALDPELKPGEWRELTDDEVALLEIEQFDGDFGTLDGIANETK